MAAFESQAAGEARRPPSVFLRTPRLLLVIGALALAACGATPDLATGSLPRADAQRVSAGGGEAPSGTFGSFVEGLWPEAKAQGVSRKTFDQAFAGVTPDPKVIALTRKQAEFSKPIWEYLEKAVSAARLEKGERVAVEYASTLNAVERTYGVDKSVVVGVWGMETNFGGNFGNNYVIRALSTLAYERYRGDYFKKELLIALQILQEGHVSPAGMQGSWAGAMGHTQFMPSSFMRLAVDFDGDGRRDIWGSVPDALASTANYLKANGWVHGLPWGFEVEMPAGTAENGQKQSFAAWAAAGARRLDGKSFPAGEGTLLQPAGPRGPSFLLTKNFFVIKRYNNSNAYALGVAHLGDRIYGAEPFRTPWPGAEAQLSRPSRQAAAGAGVVR